jgi:hypothetical protein
MQDGGSNSGVEIKDRRPRVFQYDRRYEKRGSRMLTGRKRRRERGALSLEIGNEPGGISEPADQQCISGISSTGRIDGLCRWR